MSEVSSELLAFLRQKYGAGIGEVHLLGAGEWSRAYAFMANGRELVVRVGRHGEDFAKDRRMGEFSSAVLPIPRVIEIGEVAGSGESCAISERVHGEDMLRDKVDGGMCCAISERVHGGFLDALDAREMAKVLPTLLRALDEVRELELPEAKGFGIWAPDGAGRFESWPDALLAIAEDVPGGRTAGWRKAMESSPTGAGPFDQAYSALREALAVGRWAQVSRREIVHGDLMNRNVLVANGELTAVLDWGNSLHGDGLYDLAWLMYWWPWYPRWDKIDIRKEVLEHLAAHDVVDAGERLRWYQVHIGLDAQAYNAFTGRFDQLERNAAQTLALL